MNNKNHILAISTSSGVAKVVLVDLDGTIRFSFQIEDYQQQSSSLLPMLANNIRTSGFSVESIKAIAVNLGPGGFTSLRTACGVAQGLSVAWGVPCVTFSSFDLLFAQAQQGMGAMAGAGAVLIDARLGEFYMGCLSVDTKVVESGHYLLPIQEDLARPVLQDLDWVVVDASAASLVAEWTWLTKIESEITDSSLVALAIGKFNLGQFVSPSDCQPLYVREKVADTTAERLAKRNAQV